jgi:hypothetical protein
VGEFARLFEAFVMTGSLYSALISAKPDQAAQDIRAVPPQPHIACTRSDVPSQPGSAALSRLGAVVA